MTRSYKYSSLFTFFFLEHDCAKHCFPSVANANIFYVELFSFYWKIFKLAFHLHFIAWLCEFFLLSLHYFFAFYFCWKSMVYGYILEVTLHFQMNMSKILIVFSYIFKKNEILTWNQLYNIKYISNNVFIIFVWTKECDFILTISWFRQQCYCVGYALLFWCVVSFVYMRVRHFYCNFFFKVCKWLIHSLCIISMHRPLVISLDKEMFHWYFFWTGFQGYGALFLFQTGNTSPLTSRFGQTVVHLYLL